MNNEDRTRKNIEERDKAIDNYPGAAIDRADDDKVDEELVKERTCMLNNNPRNHD